MENEILFRINNIDLFKTYIKKQVWDRFKFKMFDYIIPEENNVKSILHRKEIDDKLLPERILDSEIDKFIILDEHDNSKGFIMMIDINRLILSLTNEIISKHLNIMVDEGIMEMCWDKNRCEFIWRPNLKE